MAAEPLKPEAVGRKETDAQESEEAKSRPVGREQAAKPEAPPVGFFCVWCGCWCSPYVRCSTLGKRRWKQGPRKRKEPGS